MIYRQVEVLINRQYSKKLVHNADINIERNDIYESVDI